MRNVVNDQVVRLERRILLAEILTNLLEESFGELKNVRLAGRGDLVATFAQCKLIGEANNLFGTGAADQLHRLRHIVCLQMLNTGVEVFDVLAHDHHVDPFALVARWHAWEFARRPYVGVRLKEFSQRDVRALLAKADRGLEWPLQRNARSLNAVARCGRYARGIALLEDLGTRLGLFPVEGDARGCGGSVKDALGCKGDLGADPVARDQGDGVAS